MTTLLDAMALGDKFLLDVAKSAVLSATTNELDTILYRQAILRDCLKNPAIVRNLYALAVETMEKEKKSYWSFLSKYPAAVLRSSIEKLQIFVTMLGKLKAAADQHAHKFESEGFTRMFAMLERIFAYPGIGFTLVNAVSVRDIPIVQALAMLIAALYIGINIVADLVVVLLIPKLRTAV